MRRSTSSNQEKVQPLAIQSVLLTQKRIVKDSLSTQRTCRYITVYIQNVITTLFESYIVILFLHAHSESSYWESSSFASSGQGGDNNHEKPCNMVG